MTTILNYCGIGGIVFVILTVCVEITPIKINPIQWLGDRFNASLKSDIASIKVDVDRLRSAMDERDANEARYRIIRFDDEIRHGTKHTEEHFNQIIDDIGEYRQYCKTHPNYKNSKAHFAIQNIESVYKACRLKNTFLV